MKISFNTDKMIVEADEQTIKELIAINSQWPHIIVEYLNMFIENRSRHLERIEVTMEIRARKEKKLEQLREFNTKMLEKEIEEGR